MEACKCRRERWKGVSAQPHKFFSSISNLNVLTIKRQYITSVIKKKKCVHSTFLLE